MSRGTWSLIKKSKNFYVSTYHRVIRFIIVSIAFNMLLIVSVYYVYFNRPDNDFYSTDGVTAPVMLTAMDMPNNTSVALLANDPNTENDIKVIPQ